MKKVLDLTRKKSGVVKVENKIQTDQLYQEPSNENTLSKPRSKSYLIYYIFIVVLFVILLFSIIYLGKIDAQNKTTLKKSYYIITPAPTPIEIKSSSAATPSTSTNFSSNSDTGTVSAVTDIANKQDIKIELLNGSGKNGLADQTKKELEDLGYVISKTGTARNIYNSTVIYFNTGKESEANLLKDALTNFQSKTNSNSSLTGNYDIVIVLGKK